MDLKKPGNKLALVGAQGNDLAQRIEVHTRLSKAIRSGLVSSCHDVSDGGMIVAAAEMCIATGLGLDLRYPSELHFQEEPAQYLVECSPNGQTALESELGGNIQFIGHVNDQPRLVVADGLDIPVPELTAAWRGTLDW
jgi:phosphoribosylformylglycinamidine synthase